LPRQPAHVRYWVPGLQKTAGAAFGDAIRNITGSWDDGNYSGSAGGAVYHESATFLRAVAGGLFNGGRSRFDASRVVPTGPENVPVHVYLPHVIYLGRPK
jgi:hypothetical protein